MESTFTPQSLLPNKETEYSQSSLFARGILIVRKGGLGILAWYFTSLALEAWIDLYLEWMSLGPRSSWSGLVPVIFSVPYFVCYTGFVGSIILTIGRLMGIQNLPDLAPGVWLKDLSLELLRSYLFVLLWGLLLIVPGLVRFIRYSFVPFIVLLEPQYREGQVDGLKTSIEFSKGVFWKLLLVPLVLGGPLWFMDYGILKSPPWFYALGGVLSFFFSVYLFVFLAHFYFERRWESSVDGQ